MSRPIAPAELHSALAAASADAAPGARWFVFDVRDAAAYTAGHLAGARHLPHDHVVRWVPQRCHTQDSVVFVDDAGDGHGPARHAAHELAHMWFRNVRYLAGGLGAWRAAGLPLEQGGSTGAASGSIDGTRPEFLRSAEVPWTVPQKPS